MAKHELTIELRNPTIEALQRALDEARAKGAPAHATFDVNGLVGALTGHPPLRVQWDDAQRAAIAAPYRA